MQVYDHINKINVYGDIRVEDLYYFFAGHKIGADSECVCGSDALDWPEHITEEFIAWIKSL